MPVRHRQCMPWLFAIPFVLAACSDGLFTDAATRVAYDIEAGAGKLRHSDAQTLIVDHTPQATPDGCAGGYTLQLSKASALLVWCQQAIGAPSTSSYSTTHHLNFVQVPKTWIVHKDRGQHASIALTKQGATIVVSDVR